MNATDVRILASPVTNNTCRFTLDRPIYENAAYYFGNKERAAAGSPLAKRLFDLEAVTSVLISHNEITVNKGGFEEWQTLGKKVGAAIREHLATGEPAVHDEVRAAIPAADVIRDRVQQVLEDEINPAVASHGGFVRLLDVRENNLFIQMGGGCQGCGQANVTLKHGVEAAIRQAIPEVGGIYDVTDHAAGRNPYYAPTGH